MFMQLKPRIDANKRQLLYIQSKHVFTEGNEGNKGEDRSARERFVPLIIFCSNNPYSRPFVFIRGST